MAKRGFDQLTGGTKDVNAQYTSIRVTESAANTFTQGTLALPVLRGNVGRSKYQVIELLKSWMVIGFGDGATASTKDVQVTTSAQTALLPFNNPDVVDYYSEDIIITTSGLYYPQNPIIHDFTDGAGHGIIIATNNMYVGVQGGSQTGALTVDYRIMYRFKNIGVDEFVGLSIQQNG